MRQRGRLAGVATLISKLFTPKRPTTMADIGNATDQKSMYFSRTENLYALKLSSVVDPVLLGVKNGTHGRSTPRMACTIG
jgi:hypothetical protein